MEQQREARDNGSNGSLNTTPDGEQPPRTQDRPVGQYYLCYLSQWLGCIHSFCGPCFNVIGWQLKKMALLVIYVGIKRQLKPIIDQTSFCVLTMQEDPFIVSDLLVIFIVIPSFGSQY